MFAGLLPQKLEASRVSAGPSDDELLAIILGGGGDDAEQVVRGVGDGLH